MDLMMAEPTTTAGGAFLGVKYAALLAGFAGAVVSLSYLRQLTKLQMSMAVVTGTFTSAYLTPLAEHWWALPGEAENAVAFLIGLTAMNIVPGFLKLSDIWKRDPQSFIPGRRGGDGGAP